MEKNDIKSRVEKAAGRISETVVKGAKTGAELASKGVKSGSEMVKETFQDITGQPLIIDGHTLLRFKGNDIKILIPDNYGVVKNNKILSEIKQTLEITQKIECLYTKRTGNALCSAIFFYPAKDAAMDFNDKDGLIEGIHQHLKNNQGLIVADSGKTSRGYDYIYSIVKSVGDGFRGVAYFLRMNIGYEDKIIEICGSFEEIGITGLRESTIAALADKLGICKMGAGEWFGDPYNPEYKKGICKNLAEKEGLDGIFAESPISQAREFIYAVLRDELIPIPGADDGSDSENEADDEPENNNQQNESEFSVENLFVDECMRKTFVVEIEADQEDVTDDKKKKERLDDQLHTAIDNYNAQYSFMSDKGSQLHIQRERSVDLIKHVEDLVNGIANHPKEFDTEIAEIETSRKSFTDTCEYAKKELEAAQKSAASAGAGIAGGAAVASITPTVAMWVATTFGTASTGTAISALSGAAATNAALAWLGGGALATGGGGMAAGSAFLAMAGPVGWGIAGATLLASVALFANKRTKLSKQKKEEIEAVLANTEKLKEADANIKLLLDKTDSLRESLNEIYNKCLTSYGKNYTEIQEDDQIRLGTLVNETKALAASFREGIEV